MSFKKKSGKFIKKSKIAIAIMLDAIDLILGNIPIVNTAWDFVTFTVLLIILKDKRLAYFSLTELTLPGLPIFGQIDALIPIATIATLIDVTENSIIVRNWHNHEKPKMKRVN